MTRGRIAHRAPRFFTTALFSLMTISATTPGPGWSDPTLATPARDLSVEWERRHAARGPVIAGYVVNSYGIPAARVSVLVEGLDSAGQVVNETVGYVAGTVPALGRAYFEVKVPDATSYRVLVASSDWIKGTGAR